MQSDMEKKIEKTLKDAGLCSRDVTPFMRVKVVGLTSKHSCKRGKFREGLTTIWNPTEDQVMMKAFARQVFMFLTCYHIKNLACRSVPLSQE